MKNDAEVTIVNNDNGTTVHLVCCVGHTESIFLHVTEAKRPPLVYTRRVAPSYKTIGTLAKVEVPGGIWTIQ